MLNSFSIQGPFCLRIITGVLIAVSVPVSATVQIVKNSSTFKPQTTSKNSNDPVITVTAPESEKKIGSQTRITAAQMQQNGGNDFGTIMRYQPLISATGVSGGSGAGKSGFDRSGYTGYNIRGLESNRVGIDVDGIPLPNATGRSYASRAGLNTFGTGRDYIGPYMYGHVDIQSGATTTDQANTATGGGVSFAAKSAGDYLAPGKVRYLGWQSDYDSASYSWHNGLTTAAGDSELSGIFVLSRRDGQETRNNSDILAAYPANWHSTALMTSGIWQADEQHKLTGTIDYYHKTNHTHYHAWDSTGSNITGTATQQNDTRRWGVILRDEWSPFNRWADMVDSQVFWQQTQAHDNTRMPNDRRLMEQVCSDYITAWNHGWLNHWVAMI